MARGRVRCGACLLVFTATDNLVIGLTPSAPPTNATGELDELLDELARDSAAPRPVPPQSVSREREAGRAEQVKSAPSAAGRPAVVPAASANVAAQANVEAPAEASAAEPAAEPAVEEIVMSPVAGPPEATVAEGPRRRERRARPERRAQTSQTPPTPGGLPSFNLPAELDFEVPPPRRRRWWLLPATLAAALVLTGQVLWFQFDLWSKDLRYRPIYELICPYVGCTLQQMRALASIQSRNLVVRSHPQTPGALIVDALLVNEAPYPQPFPLVELRFSSMAGALVAGRRFEPAEYLAGELAGSTMMVPNTPVHISLEIEDPGTEAVNYVMVFR